MAVVDVTVAVVYLKHFKVVEFFSRSISLQDGPAISHF